MSLNVVVRSILIGFLIAVPSPFLVNWLSETVTENLDIAIFFSIYLLAFIGCLIMGFCDHRDMQDDVNPVAVSGGDDTRERGVVKWFNVSKGFGFITRDSGEDVFVHYRSIQGRGRKVLRDGQRVRFNVRQGEKGLQADDVSVEK